MSKFEISNTFLEVLLGIVIALLFVSLVGSLVYDVHMTCYDVAIVYIDGTEETVHCYEYNKSSTTLRVDSRCISLDYIREFSVVSNRCGCYYD